MAPRKSQPCYVCANDAKHHCPKCFRDYCSKACQRVDWKERGHKAECATLVAERARLRAFEGLPAEKVNEPSKKLKEAPAVVTLPDHLLKLAGVPPPRPVVAPELHGAAFDRFFHDPSTGKSSYVLPRQDRKSVV